MINKMAIVGFNLTKILVERKDSFDGKLNINSKINVEDIKKASMDISKDKETLQLNFIFEISYEPEFAKVIFKGNVLLLLDPKESKEIIRDWKKKKNISDINEAVRESIFNIILRKCNIKAFSLEEELNLPMHIPLQIQRNQK